MTDQMTPVDQADLSEVVALAVDGDQEAWSVLVRRYEALVFSVARRYRLSADDADDVNQIVWTKLVQHLPRLRCPLALPGWIKVSATRLCIDTLADRRRMVATDPSILASYDRPCSRADDPTDGGELDVALIRVESARALRCGLAELTATQLSPAMSMGPR